MPSRRSPRTAKTVAKKKSVARKAKSTARSSASATKKRRSPASTKSEKAQPSKKAGTKQKTTSPKRSASAKTSTERAATQRSSSRPAVNAANAPRSLSVEKKPKAKKTHPIKVPPLPEAVDRLREICLALPATTEEVAWGEPTFRVAGKIFAMHASSGTHHGDPRPGVWILSVSLEQDLVIRARPDRYFKPPYVGPSGWIGAWIDDDPPWNEIAELLRDGWRRRAPKKIAALVPE